MAGPTRAVGHPDYSSTSTSKFIPAIWSTRLLEKFYTATVFAAISNTEYSGVIKDKGDKVIIRTVPTITIRAYTVGGGLTYEKPESASVEMEINKANYYGFEVNDVDAYQSDLRLLDEWADDAGEQLKITVDKSILGSVYADPHAKNKGTTAGKLTSAYNLGTTGSPVSITKANAVEYITYASSVLNEQDRPQTGRWAVLPDWWCNRLYNSELWHADKTGDGTSIIRNGRIGRILNFDIYMSNNLTMVVDGADTVTHALFGHKSAISFAAQMTKTEQLRNPNDFGDLVRGLEVHGSKVLHPESLVAIYAKPSLS